MDDAYDVTQPGFAGFAHRTCGQQQFRHLSAKKGEPQKALDSLGTYGPLKKKLNWWQAVNMLELNDENWLGMVGASHFWGN